MKYFLDTDEDCHWYLIPVDRRSDWDLARGGEDIPEWAEPLDGHPNQVEFYLDQ